MRGAKQPTAEAYVTATFVGGLRQGHDFFVIRHSFLREAFQMTDVDHLLEVLGPGWEKHVDDEMDETILRRNIPAEQALKRLGF